MEGDWWSLPVVAETWDGYLNDINGFHVKPKHVFHALDSATLRPGRRRQRRRRHRHDLLSNSRAASAPRRACSTRKTAATPSACWCSATTVRRDATTHCRRSGGQGNPRDSKVLPHRIRTRGSIIIVIATDAPLLPHQLKRLARRASLGLARTGSYLRQRLRRHLHRLLHRQPRRSSGERRHRTQHAAQRTHSNPLFVATVQATEEAIVNAMVAAETMTGINDHKVESACPTTSCAKC